MEKVYLVAETYTDGYSIIAVYAKSIKAISYGIDRCKLDREECLRVFGQMDDELVEIDPPETFYHHFVVYSMAMNEPDVIDLIWDSVDYKYTPEKKL